MASVTDAAVPRPRTEPVPLTEVIGGLLELSDLLDGQLRQRLAAYRQGYQDGHDAGYDQGYEDGISERKRVQQDMLEALKVHARRWEPRARETFGQPRPGDFPGRGIEYVRALQERERQRMGPKGTA